MPGNVERLVLSIYELVIGPSSDREVVEDWIIGSWSCSSSSNNSGAAGGYGNRYGTA